MVTAEAVQPPADSGNAPLEDLLALYKGLVEVSTLINAITDYRELLTAIMDVARRVMRAEGSVLVLLNEHTDELELVIARAVTGEVLTAHQPVPRRGSIAGWVFEHGTSVLVPDAYADPRFYRGLDQKTGLRTRSILCVPLLRRGTPVGTLQVVNALGEDRPAFNAADQEALEVFANLAATAIDKLRSIEELERRARFEQELAIATDIQKSFLPASLPVRADMAFAAQYRPALAVGGDFYDLFEVGTDELYFVIGDVAGKGVPAALLMAQSLSLLRLIIVPGIAPADALEKWNRMLCLRPLRGLFVTATLGRVVPSQGLVEAASAGHLPPWLVRGGSDGAGSVEEMVVKSGPPLAVVPQAQYQPSFLKPLPGEWLVFYTDGLTDCAPPGVDSERLGVEGARRMLEKEFASPQQLVATLLGGEAAHRGNSPPQDDLTLLAFGFRR